MPKPPSKIIRLFRVRIDGKDDEDVKKFCDQNTSRYLLVHHVLPHGNPHHHFYCETTFSQGNYANKLKAFFNVVGSDYCVQKCDPDRRLEFFSYLFNTKKDNVPTYVSSNGFSIIDIATYKETAKQIKDEFETKLKQKKKTQFDIVELVVSRMNSSQTHIPELVYDEVISVCKLNRTMPRPYHVRDMISAVMSFSDNRQARNHIKELTLKFFSQ